MKVFITHSHGNRPLVGQVVKTLKQAKTFAATNSPCGFSAL
jgi:hypothetical protein